MSLCTLPAGAGGGLVAGINCGEKVVKEGGNEHFRVFSYEEGGEVEEVREVERRKVFSPGVLRDMEVYQRLCRGTKGVVVVGSGGGKTGDNEIVVLRAVDGSEEKGLRWEVEGRIGPEEGREVVDLDVDVDDGGEADGGKGDWTVGWCLPHGVYITSSPSLLKDTAIPSPKPIYTLTPNSGVFRSLRVMSPPAGVTFNKRIIATIVNLPTRSGAHLLLLSSPKSTFSDPPTKTTLLSRRPLHRNIRAATSMDLISLPPTINPCGHPQGQSVLAVSGADMSVEILILDYPLHAGDLGESDVKVRTLKTFYNVHPFQITKVAWSPPVRNGGVYELKLATVSMGQTVVTYTVPLVTVSTTSAAGGAEGSSTAALFNPSSPPTPSGDKMRNKSRLKRTRSSTADLHAQPQLGMYVLPPPGTRRATIYSVTVSLGLVVVLAILLQLVFVYRGGLLVAGPVGVDALSQMGYPGEGAEDIRDEERLVEAVREAAEVVGEWAVEEGRKVAGGVVKGMVRGAVEQGVRGVLGG